MGHRKIIADTLEDREGTVSIGGRTITNLTFCWRHWWRSWTRARAKCHLEQQEHRHQLQDQTDAFSGHVHTFVCMWNMDHKSRHWKKDTNIGDEMFPQTPGHIIQRSHNQWGSESQNRKCHQAVWRPPGGPDFSEKAQTEVGRACHTIIWTGQGYPTGNSSRRETKRQTEETMGRQHQRVDWPWIKYTTESWERRGVEKAGCKIYSGATMVSQTMG